MPIRRILLLGASLLILLSFGEAGNSQKPEWKGKIVLENGVKVVKNAREPLYGELKLELEEDLSIGNPKDESTLYYGMIGIAADSNGNIFVLESENNRVQKFDSSGKLLAIFGRKGQGPGEFGDKPDLIHLDQAGNVYVLAGGRLFEFDPAGKFVDTVSNQMNTIDFVILNNGNVLAFRTSRSKEEMRQGIALVSRQGKLLKNLVEYLWHKLPRKKDTLIGGLGVLPELYFCPGQSVGIFGYSAEYKIFVTDMSGNVAMRIEKGELPEPLTNEEMEARINRFLRNQETVDPKFRLNRAEVKRGLGALPKYKPYFGELFADDLGDIFVRRYRPYRSKDPGVIYDFFDNSGRYLYRIKAPDIYFWEIKGGNAYDLSPVGDSEYSRIRRLKIKNWDRLTGEVK